MNPFNIESKTLFNSNNVKQIEIEYKSNGNAPSNKNQNKKLNKQQTNKQKAQCTTETIELKHCGEHCCFECNIENSMGVGGKMKNGKKIISIKLCINKSQCMVDVTINIIYLSAPKTRKLYEEMLECGKVKNVCGVRWMCIHELQFAI